MRALIFGVLATATSATAQPAAPGADALAAATSLVEIVSPQAAMRSGLERQLSAMRRGDQLRAILQQNPAFRAEAARAGPKINAALARAGAIQANAVGPVLAETLPATRSAAIDAYARAFSAEELTAIVAFYRTPAGGKLLQVQPEIGSAVNARISERFGPRLRAAEQAAGPKIQAVFQALQPAAARK
jgi:uncharacterized protein